MTRIVVMAAGIGGISQVYERSKALGRDKVRSARTEPYYEKAGMKMLDVVRLVESLK